MAPPFPHGLEGYEEPPPDRLGHDRIAVMILRQAEALPGAAVVAIQGSWGRGKTDVSQRIVQQLRASQDGGPSPPPVWLNPWQYGTPDLLSPLVVQLIDRLALKRGSVPPGLRKTVETLLRAASAVSLKGLSLIVPGGGALDAAAKPVDELLGYLFRSSEPGSDNQADRDPVAAMARRFRDLVNAYLRFFDAGGGHLVIVIDDLDRCLPNQQIAMLESLYFLTSAKAPAKIFIALDPALVKHAAITHYGATSFDSDQYLDKIFDLRVNLPSPQFKNFGEFIKANLDEIVPGRSEGVSLNQILRERFGDQYKSLFDWVVFIFSIPGMKNPRLIKRVICRLRLFLIFGSDVIERESFDNNAVISLILLLITSERWPSIRELVQHTSPDVFADCYKEIGLYYKDPKNYNGAFRIEYFRRLPDLSRNPDLSSFMFEFRDHFSDRIGEMEMALIQSGL